MVLIMRFQKMKIFDVNGLEDKYLNSIFNRSCHFTSTPDCDSESYKKWKVILTLVLYHWVNFNYLNPKKFMKCHIIALLKHM